MARIIVATILVILMIAMIYNGFSQRQSRIEQQSAKINELEAKLQKVTAAVAPQNGTLRDQMLCAEQAQRAFQSDQRTTDKMALPGVFPQTADFVSHYQPASSRCFVEIDSSFFIKGQRTRHVAT